jgi:membrane peptidoglycan carboxypeptidase
VLLLRKGRPGAVDGKLAARQAGYTTKLGVELAPFIEGYAHLGQWQKAYQYTLDACEKTGGMGPFLCQTWDRISKDTYPSSERDLVLSAIEQTLGCSGD